MNDIDKTIIRLERKNTKNGSFLGLNIESKIDHFQHHHTKSTMTSIQATFDLHGIAL